MRVIQKITFEAKDDAEAIRVAADRLGRDAVVLSTRPVSKGGFMGLFGKPALVVTAGLLEEDLPPKEEERDDLAYRLRAFQQLLEAKSAVTPPRGDDTSNREEPGMPCGEDRLEVNGKIVVSGRSAQTRQAVQAYSAKDKPEDGEMPDSVTSRDLSKDVDRIQRTLALVLERLDGASDRSVVVQDIKPGDELDSQTVNSLKLDIKSRLINAEMTPSFVDRLVDEYDGPMDERSFRSWLCSKVNSPYKDNLEALGGPKAMFIGPTGVGKTTTIAKLAAISSLWEDRQVALATSDTYRIAAVEQLRTYAKILGVPVEVIFEPGDLQKICNKSGSNLVLLDTAGRSQRDRRRLDEIMDLYDVFQPDSVHLVISASSKYRDMLDVIDRMGNIPISNLIFTKLDETLSLGPVLETVINFDIPVSFFTVGQTVPNDIEVASAERLVDMIMGGEGRG